MRICDSQQQIGQMAGLMITGVVQPSAIWRKVPVPLLRHRPQRFLPQLDQLVTLSAAPMTST